MIIFEGKMFNEENVTFASVTDNFNSKKMLLNSTLRVYFAPETCAFNFIDFTYSTHNTAISKLIELNDKINLQKLIFPKVRITAGE